MIGTLGISTKFAEDNMIKSADMLVYQYFSEGLFDLKIFGSSACEKGVGDFKYKNAEEQDNMIESNEDVVDDTDDDDYMPTTSQVNQRDDSLEGGQIIRDGTKRNCYWYGTEIFRSGRVRQPLNPYFVTKTRPNRACGLYIPMDCIKCFDPQLAKTIVLVDPRWRKFQAKRTMWKDGRVFYTEGWKRLCRVNLMGEDDKCIRKFIQEGWGFIP